MHEAGYYALLGVDRSASVADIKSAYRSKARASHPDTGGSTAEFHELREAYEILSDPRRRAEYDRGLVPTPLRAPRRARDFGEDPTWVASIPLLDPETIPWWSPGEACPVSADRPGHAPAAVLLGWLVLVVLPIMAGPLLVAVWLLLATAVAIWIVRRHVAQLRSQQRFSAEFGTKIVYGAPGADADQWGERLTAELMERYLTRLPNVRIFHGLAMPGSVFADIDHAVLAGGRLVLIESKMWLPGTYGADEDGTLWRDDHLFRGGATRLPEAIEAYRELLPGAEVRGALVVYPSRAGEIRTEEDFDLPAPPMTPEQFVTEIGGWLASSPSTMDVETLRTVRRQVA